MEGGRALAMREETAAQSLRRAPPARVGDGVANKYTAKRLAQRRSGEAFSEGGEGGRGAISLVLYSWGRALGITAANGLSQNSRRFV